MNSEPGHEILPGLWLGNKRASQDIGWLKARGIRVIFNCTKDIPFPHGVVDRMYRVPVDDSLQQDDLRNLEHWSWEICYKLQQERQQGHPILVHCFAGMQRSAAVVAMYLIACYRCPAEEAIAFIKSKRNVAFLGNVNFLSSIKGFERGFQRMIVEKNMFDTFPRIPLPR